jgi:6-phosphogluconate dehydrogenase
MVAAGPVVDSILFENGENSIMEILSAGDIFIDGVNSHYKQSIERAKKLNEKGIQFVDAGISGGIEGARNGACAMVGCSEETWSVIEPLFKDLTIENGYERFGNNGAGHFVKMVHNAIEYGMMQVIGEGMNLINSYEEDIDEHKLLKVWNNGSIIESKLLGFLHKALENKEVEDLPSKIGSLGTGKWAVEDALERNIPLTAIAHAVSNRFASRDSDSLAFKIIQAMRAEFGGHDSKQQ